MVTYIKRFAQNSIEALTPLNIRNLQQPRLLTNEIYIPPSMASNQQSELSTITIHVANLRAADLAT